MAENVMRIRARWRNLFSSQRFDCVIVAPGLRCIVFPTCIVLETQCLFLEALYTFVQHPIHNTYLYSIFGPIHGVCSCIRPTYVIFNTTSSDAFLSRHDSACIDPLSSLHFFRLRVIIAGLLSIPAYMHNRRWYIGRIRRPLPFLASQSSRCDCI